MRFLQNILSPNRRLRSRFLQSLLAAATLAGMSGCINDIFNTNDEPAGPEVTMKYEILGFNETRALTPTALRETAMVDAYIFFYDQNGAYVNRAQATPSPATRSLSFNQPSTTTGTALVAGKAYRTVVVGNISIWKPKGYDTFDAWLEANFPGKTGKTYDELRELLTAWCADYRMLCASGAPGVSGANVNPQLSNCLPLIGEVVNAEGLPEDLTLIKAGANLEVKNSVIFSRAVCRVDLHNDARNFVVKSVRLANWRKGGYYMHEDRPYSDGGITSIGGADEAYAKELTIPTTSTGVEDYQTLKESLYAFPNMVGHTTINDESATYLIIEGYYLDNNRNYGITNLRYPTFYRVNIANEGEAQVLERNRVYRVRIKGVAGHGAENPETVNSASMLKLETIIETGETWDEENVTLASDAQGTLQLSTPSLAFPSTAGDIGYISVTTTSTASAEAPPFSFELSNATYFNAVQEGSKIKISTISANTATSVRQATLTVRCGNKRLTVRLTQNEKSMDSQVMTINGEVGDIEMEVSPYGHSDSDNPLRFVIGYPGYVYPTLYSITTLQDDGTGLVEREVATNDVEWNASMTYYHPASQGWHKLSATSNTVVLKPNTTPYIKVYKIRVTPAAYSGYQPEPVTLTLRQKPLTDLFREIKLTMPDGTVYNKDQLLEIDEHVIECFDAYIGKRAQFILPVKIEVKTSSPYYFVRLKSTFLSRDAMLYNGTSTAHNASYTPIQYEDTEQANKTERDTLSFSYTEVGSKNLYPYLVIANMGPGDPDIRGTLYIYAEKINSSVNGPKMVCFPVKFRLTSSCLLGDCVVNWNGTNYLVADRNLTAPRRFNADGEFVPAQTSTATNCIITGLPNNLIKNDPWGGVSLPYNFGNTKDLLFNKIMGDKNDFGNLSDYYTGDKYAPGSLYDSSGTTIDPKDPSNLFYNSTRLSSDWKIMDYGFFDINYYRSKGRLFIVSRVNDGGVNVGCYLPDGLYHTDKKNVLSSLYTNSGTMFSYAKLYCVRMVLPLATNEVAEALAWTRARAMKHTPSYVKRKR